MLVAAVGFLLGCLCLGQLMELPHLAWSLSLIVAGPLAIKIPRLRFPTAILLGFCWALLSAHIKLATVLPVTLEGQALLVSGKIDGIPVFNELGAKFIIGVEQMGIVADANNNSDVNTIKNQLNFDTPKKIQLAWYKNPPDLRSGDIWQLNVKLKRPSGLMNPGSFDYEAWLFRHGIDATGYVTTGLKQQNLPNQLKTQRLSASNAWNLDLWRQIVAERITATLGQSSYIGLVSALTVGDRSKIDHNQWLTLSGTGTNHLMAISGLHIGMVAGLGFWLIRWLWSRNHRRLIHFPAQKAGALGAIFSALVYAALAGFAIPTQRALLMVIVAMAGLLLQRNVTAGQMLASALLGVLIIDPLAPMDAGFWLSFTAVSVLIYGMSHRLANTGLWWRWGRAQWLTFAGLGPLVILYFAQLPLSAPFANIVAIPWVSLVTVPLSLAGAIMGMVSVEAGGFLFQMAGVSLQLVWPWLEWLQHTLPVLPMVGAPPLWSSLIALVGMIIVLAPKGIPARWLGCFGLLPLLWPMPSGTSSAKLVQGQMLFTLLDVGQGLSAVIQTRHHSLVYDTGPRYSPRFDTGSAVLVPYLRSSGVTSVDTLILSHNDRDHVGAAETFLSMFTVDQILSTWPDYSAGVPVLSCINKKAWEWDGVAFEILYPPSGIYPGMGKDNNRSCVLRVSTGTHSVLLVGDIERTVERQLINLDKQSEIRLSSEILVAPHHGSASSSTNEFIDTVKPRLALFAVGYKNRYGFPKIEVLERYLHRGIEIFSTSNYGAMTFRLGKDTATSFLSAHRVDNKRYWHSH